MTGHELIAELRQIIEQLDDLRLGDEIMPPVERLELYAAIEIVPRELAVLVQSMRLDALHAMGDLGVPKGTLLGLSSGAALVKSRNVGKYAWRGHALCDALAEYVVEPETGVMLRAVPVERLRAVIPACASDALTSSKWNAKAVERFVPIEQYRDGEPVYEDTIEIVPSMAVDER